MTAKHMKRTIPDMAPSRPLFDWINYVTGKRGRGHGKHALTYDANEAA